VLYVQRPCGNGETGDCRVVLNFCCTLLECSAVVHTWKVAFCFRSCDTAKDDAKFANRPYVFILLHSAACVPISNWRRKCQYHATSCNFVVGVLSYINAELDCIITWNCLYFCTKYNIKEIMTNVTKDTKPLFFCNWLSMDRKRLNAFSLDLSLFMIFE
jgi:hypothetical protein